MVNFLEFVHAVDLLERYAPRSVIDKALQSVGLDRTILGEATGFLPYATEAIVVEAVARAIGDRHLGARIGRDFDYSSYGAYSGFVLGAPDLASALDRGRRALSLTHPGSQIVMRETRDHLVVGRNSEGLSVIGHRHLDEGALFVIGHVVRHFLGPEWQPDWVEIPAANSGEANELRALVGCPIHVDAPMPAIAIRKADLATANPGSPALDRSITLTELGTSMGVSPALTMRDAVVQILQMNAAGAPSTQDEVARLLAIGPRTLQRALKGEGTSFRQLQSEVLERRARSLLAETDVPVDAIARMLGYVEPRSFRRAFKGWTGLSPSIYRSRLGAP